MVELLPVIYCLDGMDGRIDAERLSTGSRKLSIGVRCRHYHLREADQVARSEMKNLDADLLAEYAP